MGKTHLGRTSPGGSGAGNVRLALTAPTCDASPSVRAAFNPYYPHRDLFCSGFVRGHNGQRIGSAFKNAKRDRKDRELAREMLAGPSVRKGPDVHDPQARDSEIWPSTSSVANVQILRERFSAARI